MAAAIESLGASATNTKVPLEEQLSVLGMLQATMSGSEAGTKYAAFIQSAAKGGEELGLAFVDANNQIKSLRRSWICCVESMATPSTPSRSRRSPRHSAPMRP